MRLTKDLFARGVWKKRLASSGVFAVLENMLIFALMEHKYLKFSSILNQLEAEKQPSFYQIFLEGIRDGYVLAAPLMAKPIQIQVDSKRILIVDDHLIVDSQEWQRWYKRGVFLVDSSSKNKPFFVSLEEVEVGSQDILKMVSSYRESLKNTLSSVLKPKKEKGVAPKDVVKTERKSRAKTVSGGLPLNDAESDLLAIL